MRDDPEKYTIIILIITIFFAGEYKSLIIVLFELFIMIISKPAAFLGQRETETERRRKKIFDSLIPSSGKGWEEHGTVLFWHPVPLSQWITQGPILNFESGWGTLLWHGPVGIGVFLSYPNTFNWLNCINQRAWKPALWGKPRRCDGMFDRGLLLN